MIEPFRITVPQTALLELKRRIHETRWPIEPAGATWTFGPPVDYMKSFAARWSGSYDWSAWEKRLNDVPNFRATIDGQRIHFLIERGSGSNPIPLLLLHGWPGSIVEFIDVIDPLAHPERYGGDVVDAFTVVVPSLPGFGFSDPPNGPLAPRAIAGTFASLMNDLFAGRPYFAQGGDWGAIIASWMALNNAPGLVAVHLNSPGLAGGHHRPEPQDQPLSVEERTWLKLNDIRREGLMGYHHVQGSEPQAIAYALQDSPIGLAAWIVQRFHAWSVRGSDVAPPFDIDHLITNVMFYWLNGIAAPNWLYVNHVKGTARNVETGCKVSIPVGFTLCANDNSVPPPRRWIERVYSTVEQLEILPSGGHFFALEQPELFTRAVRDFYGPFR